MSFCCSQFLPTFRLMRCTSGRALSDKSCQAFPEKSRPRSYRLRGVAVAVVILLVLALVLLLFSLAPSYQEQEDQSIPLRALRDNDFSVCDDFGLPNFIPTVLFLLAFTFPDICGFFIYFIFSFRN